MTEIQPIEPVEIVAGRFQLRPTSVREAAEYLEMFADPEVRRWNSPSARVGTLEEVEAWCALRADCWSEGRSAGFSIFDAAEGKLLGSVSLHSIDRQNQNGDIGYTIMPWARGAGVATAGVKSVMSWGFGALGLVRIQLFHATGNAASCRVATKAGFQLEGETRSSHRYGDGALHNEHLHGRLVSDSAVF